MDMVAQLAGLLARERQQLETLLFRLVELRQLVVAGEGRFLSFAADDVRAATAAVRAVELERALLISSLAAERGVSEDALTLAALVDTAPAPWPTILAEHRTALSALAREIDEHVSATRRLARAGAEVVLEVLDRLGGEAS